MNEIINIRQHNGRQGESARELHSFLEIGKDFTSWCKQMFEYGFEEGNDYTLTNLGEPDNQQFRNPNPKTDYGLTIECAKEICMIQRTDKGKQARTYFIECERKLKESLPKDLSRKEILLLALEAEERAEKAQKLLDEAKPKVDFYDEVTESKDVLDFGQVAKLINKKGFGRNNLFEFLRKQGVLRGNTTEPYQNYVDRGWFKIVESKYKNGSGNTMIGLKTVVYQKGVDGILRLLKKEGIE